ncbi:S8 family peptidase [Bradyrhizobium brasilense]|uniref:S8 family peptidase n=1 Tax=Bradyrhizobium brasilense TaxID=1419277 RepID=UPI001E4A35FA|nr:S8 family serine peptidase [Bradyrhizobium brasilense]MCC8969765.1 S8 family serine peptidase [Bradyrhizobium brasilense]
MADAAVIAVNGPTSPLRAVPVVEYSLPAAEFTPSRSAATTEAAPVATTNFVVECLEFETRRPLADVRIDAFGDASEEQRAIGFTDATGRVSLNLPGSTIDRLYVDPGHGHWGAYRTRLLIAAGGVITIDGIQPVRPSDPDYVRMCYGSTRFVAGTGVTIGVIDTGVGPHRDINLVDGRNTVTGEPRDLISDWLGHGTHVAGLIGSSGTQPTGRRGIAPKARIIGYRVFNPQTKTASNYAILKAMIFAAEQKCDILNLSLAQRVRDVVVEEAVADARNQGMLVIVAAGNNGRQSVSFPAAYAGATAISALGNEKSFPPQSLPAADIARPPGSESNPDEFIAQFSNFGREIALTAPGVGIVSTLPNDTFGMFSGTSMAAPVVAGAAACLLSRNPSVFEMARDRARSDAIERQLQVHCIKRGFGADFEGFGMPDPNEV